MLVTTRLLIELHNEDEVVTFRDNAAMRQKSMLMVMAKMTMMMTMKRVD